MGSPKPVLPYLFAAVESSWLKVRMLKASDKKTTLENSSVVFYWITTHSSPNVSFASAISALWSSTCVP